MSDQTAPQTTTTFFGRIGHALANGLHSAAEFVDPIVKDVENVVEKEIPAVEHDIVVWAQSRIPTLADELVAAELIAAPQLSGFKPELVGYTTNALTLLLGELAKTFPEPTGAKS